MSRISIKLTNEHISLIKNFRFRKIVISHENSNLDKHVNKIAKYVNELCPEDDFIKEELNHEMFCLRRIACASKVNAQLDENRYYGIDTYDFFDNGKAVYSEMSNILGYNDHIIKGSEKMSDSFLIIENVRDLDLEQTLDCGQSFRWKKREDGSFAVIRRRETLADYFATFDGLPIAEKLAERVKA